MCSLQRCASLYFWLRTIWLRGPFGYDLVTQLTVLVTICLRRLEFGYDLVTFWLRHGYDLVAMFWLRFGYAILVTLFWLRFGYAIFVTVWLRHFGYLVWSCSHS